MKPGASDQDPAFPVMAMDILSQVLSRANKPSDLGTYLTEEVRDLTGARCVMLIQCPSTSTETAHRVVSVNPPRRREWAESPEGARLFEAVHRVSEARLWRGEEPSEAAGLLRREGFELSMVFPLISGECREGAMLVLGLPDEEHITSVLSLLNNLSVIVAMVLRNAILYETQEQLIQVRTAELRDNNAQLVRELAERKRAEEALRQSEIKFRQFVDTAYEGILAIDTDGRITFVNARMAEMLDHQADELIGQSVESFMYNDDLADHAGRMAARRQGIQEQYVRRWRRKGGEAVWTIVSAAPVFDAEHRFRGSFAMVTDITERKRAEEALKRELNVNKAMSELSRVLISEASNIQNVADTTLHHARALTGSAHGFVSLIDPRTGDHVAYALTSMMQKECQIAGKDCRIAFPAGSDGRYPKLWGHALNTRQGFYTNSPATHAASAGTPSGHIPLRNFLAVPALVKDKVAGEVALANANRDYTDEDLGAVARLSDLFALAVERTETEKRLRESEQRWRTLLQTVEVGVVIHDPETKIVASNAAAQALLGMTDQPMSGKAATDAAWRFVQENGAPLPLDLYPVNQVVSSGRAVRSLVLGIVRPDRPATTWVLVNAKPVHNPDGTLHEVIMGFMDITKHKQTQKEIIRLNAELELRVETRTIDLEIKRNELEESQKALMNIVEDLNEKTVELEQANTKLKELDRLKAMFIASMSHELRTPLNSVIGFSSILLDEWSGPVNDEQKKNLAIILRCGKHLLNLINDVIDVSKIETGNIESVQQEFDLHDLIHEAVSLIQKELEEKGLDLRVAAPHQQMHTDRRRLLQCVLNLLSNAVKFTERGSVTVEAQILDGSGEALDGGVAEIAVTDTGMGIRGEDLPSMFQPFVRLQAPLHPTIPGTGLGLYLTRKLTADVLKGDITLTSKLGQGSRFTLCIPVRTT